MESPNKFIWIWIFFVLLPVGYMGAAIKSGAGNSTGHVQLNIDLHTYCAIKMKRLGNPDDVMACIHSLGDLAEPYSPQAGPPKQ